MNRRVLTIYKRVMDLPEGLSGKDYRRETRKRIRALPREVKDDVLSRADEIDESSWENFETRKQILLELGFTDSEAQVFARCRINSPGIRKAISERVAITRYAKPDEIRAINDGQGSILSGLMMVYGKGGNTEE